MELRPLGNTGVEIPVIGLGTYLYRGGVEPLRRGMELGARFIDTAEMYGTEAVVGEAVRGQRDTVFIASKVLGSHLRYQDVLEAADNSLRRLGTDWIDLYQIHWPSSRVPIGETMGAMEELVDQGKVRHIGVSNFSLGQLREAQQAMQKYPIVANQMLYNLADRRIERDLLPHCQKNQITIIAYSPLDRGGLTSKSLVRRRRAMATLAGLAAEVGKTMAQVCINWCLSRPWVVAIPKANRAEHVAANCGGTGWALTPDQVRQLDEAFS